MAQIKNGTVDSVQSNGSWKTKDGSKTFYKFEVAFTDGTVGEYSSIHVEQNKFEVGATLDYEYIDGKFPKIKPVYAKPSVPYGKPSASFGKSDDVQVKIVRQSMLKASVDFWAIDPKLKPSIEDVLKTAERFVEFVDGNDAVQFSKEFTTPSVQTKASDYVNATKTYLTDPQTSGGSTLEEENLPF